MISIDKLSFRYKAGSERVIRDLSWTFPRGSLTVITGPSGYGKSTLLWLLGLMLTPTTGTVYWHDEAVSNLNDIERSRFRSQTIGFVFQDAALDTSRTVLDNVIEGGLYAGMHRAEAILMANALLERFSVDLRVDHLPGEISGGQAQRVALCRALLKNPSVVLADEPSGNLDDASAEIVWNELFSVAHDRGGVVVVATHDRVHFELADHQLDLVVASA